MALYINGKRVIEGTGKVVYETAISSGVGQFTICEDEATLTKLKSHTKHNVNNLTNIEKLYNAKPNSYIIGLPSLTTYATPRQELVIYETDKPVPVFKLRYTDVSWEEYGKFDKNATREFEWSLPQILYYINEPEVHSEEWQPYDETDWGDGLEWDSMYEPVSIEPVRYE